MERKILAVLYVPRKGKKTRFLVVRDAQEEEWSFISGTCEPREPYPKCALREIYEETRGLIDLRALPKSTRHMVTTYNRKNVHVLFIPLRRTEEQMAQIVTEFANAPTYDRPEMEENTHIRFETLRQFKRRALVWTFIKDLYHTEEFMSLCPK